jgi:hypothetical protein
MPARACLGPSASGPMLTPWGPFKRPSPVAQRSVPNSCSVNSGHALAYKPKPTASGPNACALRAEWTWCARPYSDRSVMLGDIKSFLLAQKSIPAQPDWVIGDSDRFALSTPLDVDGVTMPEFLLRGAAMVRRADVDVVLQLERHPFWGSGGPICRMEWNPLRGHTNKGCGPKSLQFKEMKGSHYHPFELNWEHSEKEVRRGNLPIAMPIDPEPENFRQFLALAGKEFRIKNIQSIGVPEWQPDLL